MTKVSPPPWWEWNSACTPAVRHKMPAGFAPARKELTFPHEQERSIRVIVQRLMRARRLNSSLIDRILFDDEAATLSIWFRRSGKYVYHGVPRAIYDALDHAASAGTFFNQAIKGRFECHADPARRRHPFG